MRAEAHFQHFASRRHEPDWAHAAANEPELLTDYLYDVAVADVASERAGKGQDPCLALLVLQQRTGPAELHQALAALQHATPAVRQLGAQILREFPRLDSAPQPWAPRVVRALEQAMDKEPDDEVFRWQLSALAWQCHPEGTPVLLRYRADHRAMVRYVVAGGLLMTLSEDHPLSDEVAEALADFLGDPDAEVVWSVLHDLREFSDLLMPHVGRLLLAARQLLDDPRDEIREIASEAVVALQAVPPSDDHRTA